MNDELRNLVVKMLSEGKSEEEIGAFIQQRSSFPKSEPSGIGSTISSAVDKVATPLSGGWFRRQADKLANVVDDPSTRRENQHPLKSFGAGAIQGVGDVLDNFTAPADLVAMGTGFGALSAASRGLKGANTLRRISQAASAPIAYHGGETLLDSDKSLSERAFGLAELAGGAAGTYFPKSALTARSPKPTPEMPSRRSTEVANYNFPESQTQNSFPKSTASRPQIGEIIDTGGVKHEILGYTESGQPKTRIVRQDDPNFNQGEGNPELAGSTPYRQGMDEFDASTRETLDGLLGDLRTSLDKPKSKVKSQGLENPELAGSTPYKASPEIETKVNELFPGMKRNVNKFMKDESGEFDLDKLVGRQSIDDIPDVERGVGRRLPGEEAIDIGDVKQPIDLNAELENLTFEKARPINSAIAQRTQQPSQNLQVEFAFEWPEFKADGSPEKMYTVMGGPEKGSTLSATTLRERGIQLPDEIAQPLSPELSPKLNPETPQLPAEFAPDIRQVNEDVLGGTSPRFMSEGAEISKPKSPIIENAHIGRPSRFGDISKIDETELQTFKNSIEKLRGRERTEIPELSEPSIFQKAKKAVGEFAADESGEIRFGRGEKPVAVPPPPRANNLKTTGNVQAGQKSQFRKLPGKEELVPDTPIQERKSIEYPKPSKTAEAWNLARGTMSVDLPFLTSAAFRQASPLAWTKGWFKAWGDAAKSFGDENAYKALMGDIMKSEYFKPRYKPQYNTKGELKGYKEMPSIAEELGVKMTDVAHLTTREERIMSTLAEKLPLGWGKYNRASNRAYTGFLNSLRKSQLEKMMEQAKFAGAENDVVIGKQIADFINDATGRSSLKTKIGNKEINLETSASALANVLWSPRLLASRIRMLNPQTYMGLDPMVRQERLKGLMRTAATWWGFAGLASMAGAEVGMDPTNANFGKVKIGDTRIDPGAGFIQFLVFASRMAPENDLIGGKFTSSVTNKVTKFGEGYKPRTRMTTAEEFGRTKLHPMAALALDLFNVSPGRPVHIGDRAVQMAIPLAMQDILEIMQEDPELALMMAPLASVGFGSNTYGRTSRFGDPVFTDSIEDFLDFEPKSLRGTVSKW